MNAITTPRDHMSMASENRNPKIISGALSMKEMSVQREQMAEIWEDGRNILLIIRTMTHVSM